MDQPLISIVICSHTSQRLGDIRELLVSLTAQTYKHLEVVFMAESDRDLASHVARLAQEAGLSEFRWDFRDDRKGLSASRNTGIGLAKGDIIAFLDDDVVALPDWAENMVAAYRDETVIGVTGPAYPLWMDDELQWLPKDFYWIVSCTAFVDWQLPREVRTAWGMNMSFRRDAFKYCLFSDDFGATRGQIEAWKAGPFDDAQFSLALRTLSGKKILYIPNMAVHHRVYPYRVSYEFVRRQSYWQGYSKAIYRRMYPHDGDLQALARERAVLGGILLRVIPRALLELPSVPSTARRKLGLAAVVLSNALLGYAAGMWPERLGFTRSHFS